MNSKMRTANFSDSFLRHLNAYAVAAGAAGVGSLALAPPANAQIIYTPTKIELSTGGTGSYALNPAGSSVAPFNIFVGFTSPGAYWDLVSFNPNTSGARFVKGPGTSWSVAPLQAGALIGSRRGWGGSFRGLVATYGPYGGGTYNNHDGFPFDKPAFIGFKFQISGETHYGWARVEVRFEHNAPKRRLRLRLTGYAYEATANKPIKAGQISGGAEVDSPQAALNNPAANLREQNPSLGLLSLGAVGVPDWRR